MGVQERKAREKRALRKKIVKTASKLFLQHGYEGTSIRMIAKAIEYSPATIYLYFKDKGALFQVILEEAFTHFRASLDGANIIADPLSRLQEICRRYVQFAKDQPFYYDLLFFNNTPFEGENTPTEYAAQTHELFIDTIRACKRSSYFLSKNPETLSLTIWSFVHGLSTLSLKGRLDKYGADQQKILTEDTLNDFFGILRSS